MKNLLPLFAILLLSPLAIQAQKVKWIGWDEAVAETKKEGNTKKVFIDVYTDWCGWCKKMDKDTFQNPEVAEYMAEHYLMVKFNAESKEPIEFEGKTYKFIDSGRRGYHELAAALLQGRLSYPTVLFMDEKLKILSPVSGYQRPRPFIQIAKYFGDNIYKDQSWDTYSKSGK